jgi:hypothetical protein
MEVLAMETINATVARREWSTVIDSVVHEKPAFIKRTRDLIYLLNNSTMEDILSKYNFTADLYTEADGSVTLSLKEIDLAANGKDFDTAMENLVSDIKEYAEDYYKEFSVWYAAPNRKPHLPYIMRVLLLENNARIRSTITCQAGKN